MGSEEHLEALSLGFLLSKHSTANDLIDSSYNRYMFNDPEGLPDWFVEDEKKYNRPQLPMTKEVMERLRRQFQNDDRTIKKERERWRGRSDASSGSDSSRRRRSTASTTMRT